MYEAHSERWKMERFEAAQSPRCVEGWLIERIGTDANTRLGCDPPRYLQIGTGQWCAAQYATLFPLQSNALVYAKEFGYEAGRDVRCVWHRLS